MIRFGLSVMPEPEFAAAAAPLFSEGIVTAAEWSFDTAWGSGRVPGWLDEVLEFYATQSWLLGHGVSYSLLGAGGRHRAWLDRLRAEVDRRRYRWITEHIGFVGAGRFRFAAPLPVPVDAASIALAVSRLVDLANVAGVPVGVENLATCLSRRDARDQGHLVSSVLDAAGGIALLDLHNLWCQSVNTGVPVDDLLATFPLIQVREIHVAGGRSSFGDHSGRSLRRDTHDALVPTEVLDLLGRVAPRCPNLEVVVYERLGTSLDGLRAQDLYRDDVRRVADAVADLPSRLPAPIGGGPVTVPRPANLASIGRYQADLLDGLSQAADAATLQERLGIDGYRLDPDLVAVGAELVRTWGRPGV